MKNFFVLIVVIVACSKDSIYFTGPSAFPIEDGFFSGKVQFQKLTSTEGFRLLLKDSTDKTIDQVIFRYVPYQFDTADIDRNGTTEVLVGLIKSTKFDPVEKKRLFILRIDNGHLRPLWLGSRVCQELVDFKSMDDGDIQTLEKAPNGTYSLGNYYWESFGLTLRQYTKTEASLIDATQLFEHEN